MHYVRGIRTRALRKRHSASFLAAARKRREKQALAFAEIERSGHSQQPDTKCQMQGISAKARLLSVDASLLRVNSPAPLLNESSSSANTTDKHFLLVRFCFSVLNKRDSARCVASCRLYLRFSRSCCSFSSLNFELCPKFWAYFLN